jgi:uncharacterized damage-inducible protein DinB
MNPDQAKLVADFLLSTLERELPVTLSVFGAVPGDRLDYRPDGKAKTAIGLMRHITLEDEWFLDAIATGRFAALPDDSDACGILTPADAVACYRERIPAAVARIRAMPDDQLLREVSLFGKVTMPALGFLQLALQHSAHHRGQLSTYLRPMGGQVPPIYGPSADTQAA